MPVPAGVQCVPISLVPCLLAGCRIVAGTDGHMKARRSICANQVKQNVVPVPGTKDGFVQRGCTGTPKLGSRFCACCASTTASAGAAGTAPNMEVYYLKRWRENDHGVQYLVKWKNDSDGGVHKLTDTWVAAADLEAHHIITFHGLKATVVPPFVQQLPHVQQYATECAMDLSQPPPTHKERRGGAGTLAFDDHDQTSAAHIACNTEKDKKKGTLNATTSGASLPRVYCVSSCTSLPLSPHGCLGRWACSMTWTATLLFNDRLICQLTIVPPVWVRRCLGSCLVVRHRDWSDRAVRQRVAQPGVRLLAFQEPRRPLVPGPHGSGRCGRHG
jgi:hypothetical protein